MVSKKNIPQKRRQILKVSGGISIALYAASTSKQWVSPVVEAVVLPAHAEPSPEVPEVPEKPGTECGKEGTTKSDPDQCCRDMDKTIPLYLDECCVRPAVDSDGLLVRNAKGEFLCCDLLDKNSPEYLSYCCDVSGKNEDGSIATGADGVPICCDSLDPNSADYASYCCEDKARTPTGELAKDNQGNAICCEGANPDPEYCCIKSQLSYSTSIDRTRTDWTTKSTGSFGKVSMQEIPRWDPANGPLGRVEVAITGWIDSHGSIESKNKASAEVIFQASAVLDIDAPGGAALQVTPQANESKSLAPGDNLDVNGDPQPNSSGDDYWVTPSLSASEAASVTITDPAILAANYTSSSAPLAINITAEGTSKFIGPANMVTDIDTHAGASLTITYYCLASKGS